MVQKSQNQVDIQSQTLELIRKRTKKSLLISLAILSLSTSSSYISKKMFDRYNHLNGMDNQTKQQYGVLVNTIDDLQYKSWKISEVKKGLDYKFLTPYLNTEQLQKDSSDITNKLEIANKEKLAIEQSIPNFKRNEKIKDYMVLGFLGSMGLGILAGFSALQDLYGLLAYKKKRNF
ncbi:MAG: hypothetical protein WC413_01720 [Candidatus Nanoarchaeia archaeon]